MTKSGSKIFVVLLFLIFFRITDSAAQEKYTFFFYGLIAPASQENQAAITEDLFAAQLRSISEIEFIDKRNPALKKSYAEKYDSSEKTQENGNDFFSLISEDQEIKSKENPVLIYSIIEKNDDEIWKGSFYAKNFKTGQVESVTKQSDSFYKILRESRDSISQIASKITGLEISSEQISRPVREGINSVPMTIEGVSGTWTGEEGITKIVLMRSGRGFVIFKNGATMNIELSVTESENNNKILNIKQAANFNASFYPLIPRQKVLEYTGKVNPIEWNFILTGSGKLIGRKKSLGELDNGSIEEINSKVEWTKVN